MPMWIDRILEDGQFRKQMTAMADGRRQDPDTVEARRDVKRALMDSEALDLPGAGENYGERYQSLYEDVDRLQAGIYGVAPKSRDRDGVVDMSTTVDIYRNRYGSGGNDLGLVLAEGALDAMSRVSAAASILETITKNPSLEPGHMIMAITEKVSGAMKNGRGDLGTVLLGGGRPDLRQQMAQFLGPAMIALDLSRVAWAVSKNSELLEKRSGTLLQRAGADARSLGNNQGKIIAANGAVREITGQLLVVKKRIDRSLGYSMVASVDGAGYIPDTELLRVLKQAEEIGNEGKDLKALMEQRRRHSKVVEKALATAMSVSLNTSTALTVDEAAAAMRSLSVTAEAVAQYTLGIALMDNLARSRVALMATAMMLQRGEIDGDELEGTISRIVRQGNLMLPVSKDE